MHTTDEWDGDVGKGFVKVQGHHLTHPDHVEFVMACRQAGLKPFFYRGRYLYRGPAATVSNITLVSEFNIDVPMTWDNLGREYVVHPEVSTNEADPKRIEALAFLRKIQSRGSS